MPIMQSVNKTKVALLGSGFIADIHTESYHRFVPDAEIVAVYTRTPEKAEAFAAKPLAGTDEICGSYVGRLYPEDDFFRG